MIFTKKTEDFITLVILASMMSIAKLDKKCYQVCELFAGSARISRVARRLRLRAAALDITYDEGKSRPGSMDLTTSSGFLLLVSFFSSCCLMVYCILATPSSFFRLCVIIILRGEFDKLLGMIEICCSSWVPNSRSSTGRCYINPMGNPDYEKVLTANLQVSRSPLFQRLGNFCVFQIGQTLTNMTPPSCRSALLLLLIIAVGGVFLVEQPRQSLLPEHDRMKQVFDLLFNIQPVPLRKHEKTISLQHLLLAWFDSVNIPCW